ncbi:P2Y purinoceptor 13-like [Centropristis striata]|uniref:P2Y purinoceptor 13-like n=1 Tax=Centropristis striata TaxID=184440 RepID=UPI0027DEE7A4|nr:P2Y purinoceptor 13-like [Centropristis striata]
MSSNQTSPSEPACVYNPYVVPVLYFLMFPVALVLNGVAAWVSLHLKSTSTFVVYLKNLVAADIIMTLTMPIKAARDFQVASYTFFILSCFVSSILYSTMYTCITFLGFISVDRFFKIMMPQSKFGQNVTISKVISGIVWLILFGGTALPNIILSNHPVANITGSITCVKLKGPEGLKFHQNTVINQSVFFWVVSVIITVCYICIANKVIRSFRNSGSSNNQGQQKVKLRVFLVVVVFFVSFGPYHMVRIPYTFQQVKASSNTGCSNFSRFAKEFSLWLACTNICTVPLLYVFLCREFKDKLVSMMKSVSMSFQAALAGGAEDSLQQSGV